METSDEPLFCHLTPGAPFRGVFVARNVRVNDAGPRVTLTLADRSGDMRRAVVWEATRVEIAQLYAAQLLSVEGRIAGAADRYPNQVSVERFVDVPAGRERLARFLPPLPKDQAATVQRFDALLSVVGNAHLFRLLNDVFQGDRRTRFEEAVAAAGHHHAYRGGLLRHTVEVAELCRAACKALPFLRHDLLVAGALLHDIGKLFEMRHDLHAGDFTDTGVLEGHGASGAFFVARQVQKIEDFPKGLHLAWRRLILSHHDRPEWGATRPPALPEAVVLAKCDQISAHATEFHEAAANAAPGQTSVWRPDGRNIFTGDLGLDGLDLAGLDEPLTGATGALSLSSLGDVVSLPVRGLVAAGDGGRGSEEPEATGDRVVTASPPGGADYVVTVTGDSMSGAGIFPGDRIYVRHQETAAPGEVVIAYVPASGNVIKRFNITLKGAFLFSENPDPDAYLPIPMTGGVRIQGVVTRVERDLTGVRSR